MESMNMSRTLVSIARLRQWNLPVSAGENWFTDVNLNGVSPDKIFEWLPLWFCMREVLNFESSDEPKYVILCQSISRCLESRMLYFGIRDSSEQSRRPALVEIRLLKSFQEYEEKSMGLTVLEGIAQQLMVTSNSGYFGDQAPLCLLILCLFLLKQRHQEVPALNQNQVDRFFKLMQAAQLQIDENLRLGLIELLAEWKGENQNSPGTGEAEAFESEEDASELVDGGGGARRQAVSLSRQMSLELEEIIRELRVVDKELRYHTERTDFAKPRFGTALAHLQMLSKAQELSVQDVLWLSEWVLTVQSPNQAFLHSRVPRNRLVNLCIHSREGIHILFYMHIEYEIGKAFQIVAKTVSIREILEQYSFTPNKKLFSTRALREVVRECLHQFLARLEQETDNYRRNGSGAL
ncbi:MAG: hypothetical protein H3C47_09915 [Candidatus Cloacimonetes bacterium]|nr:hypothetical protein [Candidatus Cloacimonadota bacterium]